MKDNPSSEQMWSTLSRARARLQKIFARGLVVVVDAVLGAVQTLRLEARHSDGWWREIVGKRLVTPRKDVESYEHWVRNYDTLRFRDRARIKKQVKALRRPRFSILMSVSAPPARHLREAIESVRAQLYPHWRLHIVVDQSLAGEARRILTRLMERDRRIETRHRGEEEKIAGESQFGVWSNGRFFRLGELDEET